MLLACHVALIEMGYIAYIYDTPYKRTRGCPCIKIIVGIRTHVGPYVSIAYRLASTFGVHSNLYNVYSCIFFRCRYDICTDQILLNLTRFVENIFSK